MEQPSYATEQDVYDETGMSYELVNRLTELEADKLTELINNYIVSAETKVKSLLRIPWTITREIHIGTGEDDEFDLGPEDEDFYIDYDPLGKLVKIYSCYFYRRRKKKPLPKDCDIYSEDKDMWDVASGDRIAPSNSVDNQAGDYSMSFSFTTTAQYGRYPRVSTGNYIDRNIDIFDFMFLRMKSNTASTVVTITLYSISGATRTATFTCTLANHWYKVMLDLDDDFTGTANWEDDHLSYFTISTDQTTVTLKVDNINFNDEWCYTAPSGKLLIMHRSTDQPPADGYKFYVTYGYDPFKLETPANITSATAQLAGVKLIDYLIGLRQQAIAFELEGESMIPLPDKETMYHTRSWLLSQAKENLRAVGYGFDFVPVVLK